MRNRSTSIFAESAEDYLTSLDNNAIPTRSRLGKNFNYEEDEEDELGGLREKKIISKDYSNIYNTEETSDDEEIIRDFQSTPSYHNCIEMICTHLKDSISCKSNRKETIFSSKNNLHTMSSNAIYDLNMTEMLDEIINENDGTENSKNSLSEFIGQNLSFETVKLLVISNSDKLRNALISKIFKTNNCNKSQLEIKKKKIRAFNKNINLEIFDTSNKFHESSMCKVYYELSSGFIFIIDASSKNAMPFLKSMLGKIEKYHDKMKILLSFNNLFGNDCTINGENLRKYCEEEGIIYFPLKLNEIGKKDKQLRNLLSYILVKKIKDDKSSQNVDSKTNFTDAVASGNSSLSYKKMYRIKHYDAFDFEFNLNYRKYSVDL